MKLITYLFAFIFTLGFSNVTFAKPPHDKHKEKSEKAEKNKDLPPGLKKKLQRGGKLPPGWEKKLIKGRVLDRDIYRHAVRIDHRDYPNIPIGVEGTVVVKIDNRLVRLVHATREIIDILN